MIVGQRQAGRIEDLRFRTESLEQASRFFRGEPAERALPQRTIEQQDPRPMRTLYLRQRRDVGNPEAFRIDIGNMDVS